MLKWSFDLHNRWKANCENNSMDLPQQLNDVILAFIHQVEYLTHLLTDVSSDMKDIQKITKDDDKLNKKILSLERKIANLEKKLTQKESQSLPVAIFYKDGKPTKKKPK